jgi:hypothetical protein
LIVVVIVIVDIVEVALEDSESVLLLAQRAELPASFLLPSSPLNAVVIVIVILLLALHVKGGSNQDGQT